MTEDDWKIVEEWAKPVHESVPSGQGVVSGRMRRLSLELLRRRELDELHAAAVEVAEVALPRQGWTRYCAAKDALAKKADPWEPLAAELGKLYGWYLEIVKKHCVPKEPTTIMSQTQNKVTPT
jgi:hypothetical protein